MEILLRDRILTKFLFNDVSLIVHSYLIEKPVESDSDAESATPEYLDQLTDTLKDYLEKYDKYDECCELTQNIRITECTDVHYGEGANSRFEGYRDFLLEITIGHVRIIISSEYDTEYKYNLKHGNTTEIFKNRYEIPRRLHDILQNMQNFKVFNNYVISILGMGWYQSI